MLGIDETIQLTIDSEGFISDANLTALDQLKYTRGELIGSALSRVLPHDMTVKLIAQLVSGNVLHQMRCLLMDSDDQTLSVYLVGFVEYDQKNPEKIQRIVLLAAPNMVESGQPNSIGAFMDSVIDGLVVTNHEWRLFMVNNAFTGITGWTLRGKSNHTLSEIMPGFSPFEESHVDGSWGCEYLGRRVDGREYFSKITIHPLLDSTRSKPNYLLSIKDLTELKESEKHIRRLAYMDELTGLGNRTLFNIKVEENINYARRYRHHMALLFLDLDGFKDINDSLGHDAGDQLLKIISSRLLGVVREVDFVARLGGDEFCILLTKVSEDYSSAYVAERCLNVLAEPARISTRDIYPRGSIGIALYPRDGETVKDMVQCADNAMYAAKNAGKHQYVFYNPEMTAQAEERLSLEHNLRGAVERGEFELHYQPQISLATGKVVAVEALVRWRHCERGLIFPDKFIPVAEKIGLISSLGEWVLDTACRQFVAWVEAGILVERVAVNISGSHFHNGTLAETLAKVMDETGIEANRLEIEMTESVVQVSEDSIRCFMKVKDLGVRIAIDDFGTGYSCLSSLTRLPLDVLKIDKVFIDNALRNMEDTTIVATIISMSRALGFSVVAEGVETLEQVEFLRGIGCQFVQGYFFSKPVIAEQVDVIAGIDFFLEGSIHDE